MLNSLHVELTNRCILTCPACPRTTWKDLTKIPIPKSDLDIDDFEKFLDCPGGREIDTLVLCGDFGDCIYYPRLFEFIQRFRSKKFRISTNGSNQSEQFWNTLAGLLTKDDTIIFGVDGLEDTNHLYRRNSNWNSIMTAIDIMSKSPVKIVWQTIVFSFNYTRYNEIKQFAESKGAEFLCLKTHRYGDPSLVPPNDYVELEYVAKPEYNTDHNILIKPQCFEAKTVSCDGYLHPCDWIRNPQTFYKSQLWKQKSRWIDRLNIKDINYDQSLEILQDWINYVRNNSINGSPDVDVLCKMKCREGIGCGL